jgi:subtilisin-like proprotein convertase family protein
MQKITIQRILAMIGIIIVAAAVLAGVSNPVQTKHVSGAGSPRLHNPLTSRGHMPLDFIHESRDSVRIPDFPGDTVELILHVPEDSVIRDVNVFVDIRHTWIRDLRISLTPPGGAPEIVLVDYLPLDNAVNINGWFSDQAAVSIMQTDTPLVGVWSPLDTLARLNGLNTAGDWTLKVLDRFRIDSGYVRGWGLDFNGQVPLSGHIVNSFTRIAIAGVKLETFPSSYPLYSDASGNFSYEALSPDTYDLKFTKSGHDSLLIPGVLITAGEAVRLDTAMRSSGAFEFASTAAADTIHDDDSASISLTIPTSPLLTIGDVDVKVNIVHTYVNDLRIVLQAPSGTRVLLASRVDRIGENFTDCRFDDEAARSINAGSPPFTGPFRPQDTLSALDGQAAGGTWRLIVFDDSTGDEGYIVNFTLYISQPTVSVPEFRPQPESFSFPGNYPNPFNSRTTFQFTLERAGDARLALYNILGQEAAEVLHGPLGAGDHRVNFDAGALPSGMYFARLSVTGQTMTRKVLLLR